MRERQAAGTELIVISRHLKTLGSPADAKGHLETLAPDALVVADGTVRRRRDVAAADLAAAWSRVPPGLGPQFGEPEAIVGTPAGEGRVLVVAALPEATTGETFRAAFGVEETGGMWLVQWAGLLEADPLPYEIQRAAALSELATLDALAPFGPFASLLDVAFARLARLPAEKLLFLPEAHFSCHGSGDCCSHGLTIPLGPLEAEFVSGSDWSAILPGVGPGPYVCDLSDGERADLGFGHTLAAREGGTCHFLREDRRCAIHALLGRAVLTPCHVFPYQFAWSPDGICVTLHHFCPSVQRQQGPRPETREGDVRTRLAVAGGVRADSFRLTWAREVSWEEFRDAEARILDILAGAGPIRVKLWRALDWLRHRCAGEEMPAGDAGEVAIPPVDAAGQEILERLAEPFDRFFFRVADLPGGALSLGAMESVLTSWFRSLVFGKTFTYAHGLVGGLNDLALIYRVVERQLRRWKPEGAPEPFWRDLFALVTSVRGAFRQQLDALYQADGGPLAAMADSPLLGQNLLRGLDEAPP